MRVLPAGHDHDGCGPAQGPSTADRRRDRRGDVELRVPVWHVRANASGDPTGSRHREARMSLTRRTFLRKSACAGAGLAIGVRLPASAPPSRRPFEPNAYIRIAPDNVI